jgi:hypothetical protein
MIPHQPTLADLGDSLLLLADQMDLVDVQEHLRERHGIETDYDTLHLAVLDLEAERWSLGQLEDGPHHFDV